MPTSLWDAIFGPKTVVGPMGQPTPTSTTPADLAPSTSTSQVSASPSTSQPIRIAYGKHRITAGQTIVIQTLANATWITNWNALVLFDDGSTQFFQGSTGTGTAATWTSEVWYSNGTAANTIPSTPQVARADGWIVSGHVSVGTVSGAAPKRGAAYARLVILGTSLKASDFIEVFGQGYCGPTGQSVSMDKYDPLDFVGQFVFQGTIAEDATAGTHVCTLTVTPGAGDEMQVLYGEVVGGNTTTSQTCLVRILDPTNQILQFVNAASASASQIWHFPHSGNAPGATGNTPGPSTYIISGAQTLELRITTAAVSVTQTFAVVCRVKGGIPTATLNDTVGTSTNTTNTSGLF